MIELIDSTLRQITELLGKLYGLPGYVSVFLLCLVLGFALKRQRWFPNEGIPLAVILSGALLMALLADPAADTLPLRVWVMKNLIFGALVGAAAWATHANRKRIPIFKTLFNKEDDTQFLPKPKPETKP